MTTLQERCFVSGSDFPALQNGTLRLYSMRFCPYAQRTRLVLAHKNIKHETVNINLKDKPDWFWEKTSLGLVPVLEQDGKIVSESLITCEYLDDMYPDKQLMPTDPYQKARDRMLLDRYSKVTTYYYATARTRGKDSEVLANLSNSLKPFEEALEKRGKYFGGNEPMMLDYMVWPHLERFPVIDKIGDIQILNKEKFPNLVQWYDLMLKVPAVQETMFDNEAHLHFFTSYVEGKPNYDIGLE